MRLSQNIVLLASQLGLSTSAGACRMRAARLGVYSSFAYGLTGIYNMVAVYTHTAQRLSVLDVYKRQVLSPLDCSHLYALRILSH